jgi:hypothetical protein
MRTIILTLGAALALTACGERDAATNEDLNAANMTIENIDMNDGMNAGVDANMTVGPNGAMVNESTANMQMNDLKTNDTDTNLANGM